MMTERKRRHGLALRRLHVAILLLAAPIVSCDDGTAPQEDTVPAALVVVSGDAQEDTVGQELPSPLVVRVENEEGDPIEGQLVNFVVTAGGGSVFAGSALTNENGEARERWTLGTSTADSQRVEARAIDPTTGEKLVFAIFTATPLPDAPDSIAAVGAAEFATEAGATVADTLAVRVTDRFGNPVGGAAVAWSTDAGGGTIQPLDAQADSTGTSRAVWTVGSTPGLQTARAAVGTLEIAFTAQVAPGAVATVELSDDTIRFGALQSTRQLGATARDRFGNVVPGAAFAWLVTSGSAATVDQTGLVRSLANGVAQVVVQSGAAADTAFALVEQVLHSIALEPAGDTVLIGDSARFVAADADSNGFAIPGSPAGAWSSSDTSVARVDATGSATAVARGVALIRFDGGQASAEATLTVMRPDTIAPTLVVQHPAQHAVARPELRIAATCTDDDPDGCVAIDVFIAAGMQLVSFSHAGGVLDTVVSLDQFEGRATTISIHGRDPMRSTSVSRSVYVESSSALHEEEVVAGFILDADAGRLLVWDSTAAGGTLRIQDRASGAADTIPSAVGPRPLYAYLTSRGAIWEDDGTVIESRDGSLVDHGAITPEYTLRVDGDYAIWQVNQTLRRLDIAAGVVVDVSTTSGNNSNDVAPNGDVVFWMTGDYDIFRYRSGTVSRVAADSLLWATYPVTDGSGIVYRLHDPCCGPQQYQLVLRTDTGSVELTARTPQEHSQDRHYRIENGWVAFVRFVDGLSELWIRSPAGVEQRIASPSAVEIEALAADGTVVFASDGRRYLWSPAAGAPARDVGQRFGRVRLIGDVPHVFVGGTLFRVE